MAGIGFRLEKILDKDTYFDSAKVYFYSALIVSGPWILSILSLALLHYLSPSRITSFQMIFFRTTITYVFAFSLIVVGFLYLSMNRYLSDKLYMREEEALVPIFNASGLLVLAVQGITGGLFFFTRGMEFQYAFLSTLIYMTISVLWLVMIFLSAMRDYNSIVFSYLIGTVATIVLAVFLGSRYGLVGYFAGYLAGNFITVILLSLRIFVEFPSRRVFDTGLFMFLKTNNEIVITGFFYNLAIWIDKIILWGRPDAVEVFPLMKTLPLYDTAVFFSYLTIIPALSVFIVGVETDFYRHYKAFYTAVLDKSNYDTIRSAKKTMGINLQKNIRGIVLIQGGISLFAITFSPEIGRLCHLQGMQIPIFKITVLGAFLHSMLLIFIIMILYFNLKRIAMWISLIFLMANGVFSYITSLMDLSFLGYGYFAAALVALITGFYVFDRQFEKIEYLTYALQPLAIHRDEEVA